MRQGRLEEAKQHLEQAVAADSSSYLAHYYYALALSRIGEGQRPVMSFEPAVAEAMRAQLKRTIELAPNFPDAYHLLATVHLVTGERLDEAATLLKRAVAIAPSRHEFAFNLANVYLRQQNLDQARKLLESLARRQPPGIARPGRVAAGPGQELC